MDLDEIMADILGPPKPDPGDDLVTAAVLADWLNLSPPRLHALAREGVLPRSADSRFPLKASVRAYADHLRQGQRGRLTSNPELNAEKVRLARANAEKVETANAKARGELIPATEVERAWAGVLRDVRAAVLAAPSRIGSRLPHLTAHDVAEIGREMTDTLAALAADEGVPDGSH